MAIKSWNYHGTIEYVLDAEADLASIPNPKLAEVALALAEGSLWFHTGTAWQEIGGGGGSGVDVEDEGAAQGAATTLDFTGAGVTASVAAGQATINIPGGGSGVAVEEDNAPVGTASTLDFGTGLDVAFAAGEADVSVDLSEVSAFTDHSARHEDGGADELSLAGLDGTPSALQSHLDDAADAHDASAISILDTAADFDATDVEGALAELQADNEAHVAAADPHTGYVKENDANYVDLTDGGQTALHSHAGSGSTIAIEEDNAAVGDASVIDFGSGFDVAFATGEADVSIDLGEVTAFTDHSARHENGGADEISLAGLDGIPTELQTHLDDATDAHDASAVSVDSTNLSGVATHVQGSLEELDNLLDDHSARHENGGADEISLAGLDGIPTELQTHLDDVTNVHDHGSLGGLTDDDHTQYLKETDVAAKGDLYVGTADDTVGILTVGTAGQRLTPNTGETTGLDWADDEFTVGGVLLDPSGARTIEVWRAPFACEIMGYRARVVGGTNAVTNAQVDSSDILTGDLTTTPADGWEAGTIVSSGVEDVTAGEVIKLEVVSISGAVTEISWTITLRRAA